MVGRKLIGINEDGALIGFYTYTSLKDEAANQELRGIFARYCADLALRCGLTLANSGTIPKLLAQAWYDDGVVNWQDVEAKQAPSKNKNNSRRAKG